MLEPPYDDENDQKKNEGIRISLATQSMGITWELVRYANSQAQTCWTGLCI